MIIVCFIPFLHFETLLILIYNPNQIQFKYGSHQVSYSHVNYIIACYSHVNYIISEANGIIFIDCRITSYIQTER